MIGRVAVFGVFAVTFLYGSAMGADSLSQQSAKAVGDPFKGLSKKRDTMQGITWYQATSSPNNRNANGIYLYFGREDSGSILPMHFDLQYRAESWLFIKRAWAKADGVTVELPQVSKGAFGWERDSGGGAIGEWSDATIDTSADIARVRQLMDAKSVTVRFEGQQYVSDRTMTIAQQRAMREVISAYEAATGKAWK